MIEQIAIFILFLGPLIFFHELGHFFFARFFGVRVETFSIGFGPKIFKWRKGDTDYALSLIPLGGYVKMFGDNPLSDEELSPEDKKVAFTHKTRWQKFWIVFGGPLANFILAFVLYFGLSMSGEQGPQARFGLVTPGNPFAEIGVQSGDRLKSINSSKVQSVIDLQELSGKVRSITLERDGREVSKQLSMSSSEFIEEFFRLPQQLRSPVVQNSAGEYFAVSNKQDRFDLSFSLEQLENSGSELWLHALVQNGEEYTSRPESSSRPLPFSEGLSESLAKAELFPLDLRVGSVVMESPADKGGVRSGDIVTSVGGQVVYSFNQLREVVQNAGKAGGPVELKVIRSGVLETLSIKPKRKVVKGVASYSIGVYSSIKVVRFPMVDSVPKGIGDAIGAGFSRTWSGITHTVDGFVKLLTNEVALSNLGGPITIGRVASESLNVSYSRFLRLMAIISINLGIINLFPIPVLDGGHILFLFLEVVNRGPLSKKKLQMAHQFGFSVLLFLIFVALFNDVSQLFQ